MWQDFTKPYKERIRVSTGVEVAVNLPASFLEEHRELPIIIEHQGLGSDDASIWRSSLKINDQSFWKSHAFGHRKYTDKPVRLTLGAGNFKPGMNTLHFSLHRAADARITWYTITELRFDLPDLAKYQKSVQKVASSTKSGQSQALPPATQLQNDAPASSVTPPVDDVAVRSPSGSSTETASGSPALDFGNYHALVIGNNDYRDIPKLKTAVNDARAVAKLLGDKYNFRVTLQENATRSDIFSAFSKLRRELRSNDSLLIYYAGHGNMDMQTQRGYWPPINAQRFNKANWVANEDITSELKAVTARHVLIVADSCYSGWPSSLPGSSASSSATGSSQKGCFRMSAPTRQLTVPGLRLKLQVLNLPCATLRPGPALPYSASLLLPPCLQPGALKLTSSHLKKAV